MTAKHPTPTAVQRRRLVALLRQVQARRLPLRPRVVLKLQPAPRLKLRPVRRLTPPPRNIVKLPRRTA